MCKSVETDPAWEGWEHWYFGQEEALVDPLDAPPAGARAAFEPHREQHHVEASAAAVSDAVWH